MAACVVVHVWKVDTRAQNSGAEMVIEGSDAGAISGGTTEVASSMGTECAEVEGAGAAGVLSEGSLLCSVGKEETWACLV